MEVSEILQNFPLPNVKFSRMHHDTEVIVEKYYAV